MKKEEFLKIFKLNENYHDNEKHLPFLLRFQDPMLYTKTKIVFYFNLKNISISISMPDSKNIFFIFDIYENDNILLNKHENFKNEIFPHLTFEKNLKIDLDFLSGVIYKTLIPQYNLKASFGSINYY